MAKIRFGDSVSFKCVHFPKSVILYAVYFYVGFGVSYRDIEEIIAERGVAVDHATFNRWVEKYAGAIADEARRRKGPTCRSWRMHETHIKAKGKWTYLYRAVDKLGNTIASNDWPDKVVIDKSGSNTAELFNMNCLLI